jgi:hypothetical protein
MKSKMYLPLVCMLFCMTYVIVASAPPFNKMLMTIAAGVFAMLLVRAFRGGNKK